MKNILQKITAFFCLSLLVGCSAPRMPLQAAAPMQQFQRFNSSPKLSVFRYKLMIPQDQLGEFMLDMDVSSDLMGLYFANPQYKTVYQRTFVDSTQLRKAQALIVSFDVFDKAVFTQQVLPQVFQKLEVKGRKLVAF
ncbi:MAG: hypothetical protein CVV27_07835 [Candidatus Melainabacteria bacterium HGW-Melainabacteria-1]|nr:MAG: hypothetical protein CVV27_07835 [Candidatus Melainabacteria bacterium HGW-Melainabacteria-1]